MNVDKFRDTDPLISGGTTLDIREYCVLPNNCHVQISDVSHGLNGFVSGLSSFSSPLPLPL